MEKYLFMRPLLGLLAQGRFFHRAVAHTLRVLAGLVVLFGLTNLFTAGKIFTRLQASGILGGVLFVLFFIAAVYAVAHALLIRARDIEGLGGGEYYALSAGATLARLAGEIYAGYVGLTAIGGAVFVWFTGLGPGRVLSPLARWPLPITRDDPSFGGGIEFVVSGVLAAIGALLVSYMLAEILAQLARRAPGTAR